MTEKEKKINSFKKYIQSQENKLDEYYKLDDSFYKDEIEQLELSILLLKSISNIIEKQQKEIEKQKYIIACLEKGIEHEGKQIEKAKETAVGINLLDKIL